MNGWQSQEVRLGRRGALEFTYFHLCELTPRTPRLFVATGHRMGRELASDAGWTRGVMNQIAPAPQASLLALELGFPGPR